MGRFTIARAPAVTAMVATTVVAGIVAAPQLSSAAKTTAKTAAAPSYYVNLGDSYAEGYQPGYTNGTETLHGYANRLVADLGSKHKLVLENFGCGGATTTSILTSISCPPVGLANNGVAYPTTSQATAALAFIKAHVGHIGLVTISIGGNDFDSCISSANPVPCVTAAIPVMQANLTTLVDEIRTATGPTTPILGITYPNVALGAWLQGAAGKSFAAEAQAAFALIINPALQAAYTTANATFVNITADTGGFIALSKTTTLKPYGVIPVAVADVCTDTWFCAVHDIHPTNVGYTLIASALDKAYLKAIG